jgi:hypothetical protein
MRLRDAALVCHRICLHMRVNVRGQSVLPHLTPSILAEHPGYLSDLQVYDPAHNAWTDLSVPAGGVPPPGRAWHGFTTAGGRLYVYAGWKGSGEHKRADLEEDKYVAGRGGRCC